MVSEIVGRLGSGGGRDRDRDRDRDRGQLLLVAAIAIAFIILGIVVVLNSTLYTQSIASDNSIERTGDVEAMELEVERGIRGYVQGVNRGGDAAETDDLSDAVESFADTYRSATADSGPKLVNVGGEIDVVENGTLISNHAMESLTGDEDNATVYNSTSGALELEHFVLTLDVDEFDGVYVVFGNDSGDEHSVLFESENGDGNIPVDSNGNSCELDPEGSETVTIDLLRGQTDATTDDDCQLTEIAEGIDGSYDEVTFESNEDESEEDENDTGWFELVVDDENEDITDDMNEDFSAYTAALTLNLPLTYDSSDLSYDRTLEVDVYGSESWIDTYGDAKPYGDHS